MKALDPVPEETTCRSCGNAHQLRFCPQCGEKRFDPRSLSIGHFFEETLEGLFHFDTKFLRTVRTLLRHPGQLSVDAVEGRRVGAVRPFQLFLIVNILIFFLLFSNPFSLPLKNYITYKPFTSFHTVEQVDAHLAKHHVTMAAFEQEFDHAVHGLSKSLIIVLIPVYALVSGLLFMRMRRRVVEHLVFATHYITFVLLVFLLMLFVAWPAELIGELIRSRPGEVFDMVITALTSVLFVVWLFFAVRRFYGARVLHALLAAVLVGGAFFYVLQAYRMLLFHLLV